ncbi:MAG: helix-turn-helix domain-containing protein [Pseudonocardiaceae bacterium]
MDGEDARTTGRRVRQVRYSRGKSLRVVAGLAGISASHLHRIETGERALDSVKQIVALATALEIAPSELIRLPAPANGGTDSVIEAVRLALMAVSHDLPGGQVQPVEQLRARVTATVDALCRCDSEREVGVALPALIADLHTSIAAGRDVAELLDLAVLLHTQGTIAWLRLMGAPLDLCTIATVLSWRAAQDRDAPAALALAATCSLPR